MEAGKAGKLGKHLPCEQTPPPPTEQRIQLPLAIGPCEAPPVEQTEHLGSDPRGSRKSLRAMVILLACGLSQKMTSHR